MATTPIERCPVCGNRLAVSQSPTACADCGFEYDRDTRVWCSAETWGRVGLTYAAWGVGVGVAVAAVQRLAPSNAPYAYPALPLVCALLTPTFGLLVRRLVSGRITGRFVALTPPGIVVGTRPRPLLIRWSEFQRLGDRRGLPRLHFNDSRQPVALEDIFNTPAEFSDFKAALGQCVHQRQRRRPTSDEAE